VVGQRELDRSGRALPQAAGGRRVDPDSVAGLGIEQLKGVVEREGG
jgi:type IV secretory pathway protease TraF